MPEPLDQTQTKLNWGVVVQVERAVTEFEAAWHKGGSTEIEGMLKRHAALPARELFCALLETELELRQLNGEVVTPQRWSERFPQWQVEIEQVFTMSQANAANTRADASPLPKPGDEFGRYRIRREVGRGAMGVVFEAEFVGDAASETKPASGGRESPESAGRLETHETTTPSEDSRPPLADASTNASRGATSPTVVAIKLLRLAKSLSEAERAEAVRRFQSEASATKALQHPHIIPVFDVGEVGGVPYFTMPLIAAGTLKQLRREAPIDPIRAARLIEAAARALHHAHRADRFHRDIKPSNLLLGPNDHVFVSDFGVSMHRDDLGRGPNIAGTPLYMSPEQSAGSANLIDGRSDIFSLGIVLYELLTGTHPFDTPLAASAEILDRICHVPVPPLRQRAEIPRPLEDICLRALRRQPEDRYATAADFAADLAEFVQSKTQVGHRRQTTYPKAIAIAAFFLALLGILVSRQWQPPSESPTGPTKPPLPATPSNPSSTITSKDIDRVAAEWLLSLKSRFGNDSVAVQIVDYSWKSKWIKAGEALPDEPFHISSIRLWNVPNLTDEAVERYLAPLAELQMLHLDYNPQLTVHAVQPIAKRQKLKILGLQGTKITGAECAELFSGLPTLKHIALGSEQFTDELVEFLRSAPTIVDVSMTKFGDSHIRQLQSLKQLTQVQLYDSIADHSTWQAVPDQLPNLNLLICAQSNLTDEDLEQIARCPKLEQLDLQVAAMTDTGLLSLQHCATLRKLKLTKTLVTEAGVRGLRHRLPNCQVIWDGDAPGAAKITESREISPDRAAAEWLLSQKQNGADGLRIWIRVRNSWSTQLVVPGQPLPDLPFHVIHVQALNVPAITGETIERFLVPLRELEILALDSNRDLSTQDLVPVARMKQLKNLGLAGTKVSGSECLAIFSQLPALSFIGLSSEQFTDDVAEFARTTPNINQIWIRSPNERQVRQLLDIPRLTHVILFGSTGSVETDLGQEIADRWREMDNLGLMTMHLTENDIEAIARLPKLKTLTLSESFFSDTGLLMLQTCTSLRALSILRTQVTEASIRCLHARLPQCRIFWDGGVIEPGP